MQCVPGPCISFAMRRTALHSSSWDLSLCPVILPTTELRNYCFPAAVIPILWHCIVISMWAASTKSPSKLSWIHYLYLPGQKRIVFFLTIRPVNFSSFIVGVIYVINTCWPSFNSKSSYRRTLTRTLPLLSTQYVHVGTYCEMWITSSYFSVPTPNCT